MVKKRTSLGRQILLSFLLFVGALLSVTLLVVSWRVQGAISADNLKQNLQLASARGDQVAELLDKVVWQSRLVAGMEVFGQGDEARNWDTIRGLKGRLSPEIADLYWASTSGKYVTSLGNSGNVSDRAYFKDVISGERSLVISDPVISKSLGVPIVVVAVPTMDAGGAINGMIGTLMRLSDLSRIMAEIKVGSTGYGWIVDRTGLILAHPAGDKAVMVLNVTDADKTGYKGLDALGREMIKGESGWGECTKPDGVPVITYYSPIKGSPGWVSGLTMPRAEHDAIEQDLRIILMVIFAAGLALSVLVALLVARRLILPIRHTAEGFKNLSLKDADLSVQINVIRNDEIGGLVTDFNNFIRNLRDLVVSIKSAQADLANISKELGLRAEGSMEAVARMGAGVALIKEKSRAQSASVSESSTAVEEIAKNIENLDHMISDQAASITQASASIEEMVGNIGSIRESADRLANQFAILSGAAAKGAQTQADTLERIGVITQRSESLVEANKIIATIAAQTNLLAMNAAIEAAHAGDAGRGFSVVADEIRRLAETSARQSRTIRTELKNVQEAISKVVESSGDLEAAFSQVNQQIGITDSIVQGVKQALAEQEAGSEQILIALREMNEVSSQVRDGSREMRVGNQTILNEIARLNAATQAIGTSLESLDEGTASLSRESQGVADMADATGSTIATMETVVGRFRV